MPVIELQPRTAPVRIRTALFIAALALAGCERSAPPTPESSAPTGRSAPAASALTYIGGAACAGCHAAAVAAWTGSDHDLAMQVADADTVLGAFDGAKFEKDGVVSTFFRRDGGHWVNTDGADGKLADFRIAYTFGVEPLQQYLIGFPDGRMQALDIAWDARPTAAGGQRWYSLHPDEKVPAGDVLHWTGPALNWNHMCAECHSTHLVKGYDASSDTFKTTWKDVDVNCEACHGPGSRHVAWAGGAPEARARDVSRGLAFELHGGDSAAWTFTADTAIAHRRPPLPDRSEVETCGRCHSRRGQVWADYRHGDALAQTHRVALLDEGLYHADGQILDEVYEYGSFLQSPMHAAGVTCSDCHDPHSGRLRAEGNAVCTQCHRATVYDAASHHHHRAEGSGSRCVDCHMIERTYMGVDGRRDHSFRVPRPDLSVRLDTPNACNDCHRDRDARWAEASVAQWFPNARAGMPHAAEAIAAGRRGAPDAGARLRVLVDDDTSPAIVRATALELLADRSAPEDVARVVSAAADPDPLLRRAAASALAPAAGDAALDLGARLLADGTRSVRLEAVDAMLSLPFDRLDPAARGALDRALAEYRKVQQLNADRVEGPLNLGTLALRQGDAAAAEREFRRAVAKQPQFVPAHVNLADALRALGREADAEAQLRVALGLVPDNADVHYALGLALIRQQRYADALAALERASTLRPEVPSYAYVLGVALHDTGAPARARTVLEAAARRHPQDRAILMALAQYSIESGDRSAARHWAGQLQRIAPDDPQVQSLLQSLPPD